MKKWHCFLVGSILTISSSFIYAPKKISIYISEYDFTFTPQKKRCNDTLTREIEDGKELKITLFDCEGKMHLEYFEDNIKVAEGDYINSLALLKKYISRIDGINGNESIKVYEYYQPLRSGRWHFYDKTGNLLRTDVYQDGVLKP
jgi:hypothetical protein